MSRCIGSGFCAYLCFAFASTSLEGQERPNVILLLADDLGYADVGAYGHPYAKTPAIDELAKSGTVFRNYYNAASVCSQSRWGIMTGRFPATLGVKVWRSGRPSGNVITITQLLRQRGYRTGHFGKWHLGDIELHRDDGIDEVREIEGDPEDERGRDACIADAAIDFIQRNKDSPFYLNVWFRAPHAPVRPPKPLLDRFKDLQFNVKDFPYDNFLSYCSVYQEKVGSIDHAMRNYLGEISQLDDQIARVLKVIDQTGLRDSTIVVFTSDNGPARSRRTRFDYVAEPQSNDYTVGFAGKYRAGKHSVYEGGIRAPWIMRWPGHIPEGAVDENSVIAAVDWLPTLGAITGGLKAPRQFDGEDVSDIWRGQRRTRQRSLFWSTDEWYGRVRAVRHGDWKLHQTNDGLYELYDLKVDPGETNNIAESNPQTVGKLGGAINDWIKTLPGNDVARVATQLNDGDSGLRSSPGKLGITLRWMSGLVIALCVLWVIWRRFSR